MIIINIECSVNQQLAGQKKWNKYYTSISQEYHCQASSCLGDTNHDYDVGMCTVQGPRSKAT